MMILLRHDDSAQVVVHTANMIPQDWANMTQAVWRSPLLPLVSSDGGLSDMNNENNNSNKKKIMAKDIHMPIGSGSRFKHDLLRYLQAYGSRTASIVSELRRYDFGEVRGAFVASVPGRVPNNSKSDPSIATGDDSHSHSTAWGWQGLRQALESVECEDDDETERETDDEDSDDRTRDDNHVKAGTSPQINIQMSSVASLGQKDTWLKAFIDTLSTSASSSTSSPVLGPQSRKTNSVTGRKILKDEA